MTSQSLTEDKVVSAAELDTTATTDSNSEFSDLDYPQVGGFARSFNTTTPSSPPAKEEQQLLDIRQIVSILNREGYGISSKHIAHLNNFPSPMHAFQYAMYEFGVQDMFFVVMINKRKRSIYGYHILDLTQQYSLEEDLVTRMKSQTNI